MDDFFLVQIRPKSHWLKAGADINILAQVFLLVVVGHWFLAALRAASEIIVRGNCNSAYERLDQEARTENDRDGGGEERSNLHNQ